MTSIEVSDRKILIDGIPTQIISGAIHYFRFCLCLLCGWQLGVAAETPRNGGFERLVGDKPSGWSLLGQWELERSDRHSGKYAMLLRGDQARPWNKLLSAGFVARVYRGDELSLTGFYKSATGNADIGLEYCDATGGHVKWSAVAATGPAAAWTRIERRFSIDEELWRLGTRTVKVYAQVTKEGADVRYDDFVLAVKRRSPERITRVAPITIDPARQTTLLHEGFESFGDGGMSPGWHSVLANDETGKIELDRENRKEGNRSLRIGGVQRRVLLTREPMAIDPKVSYVISCWIKCKRTDSARGFFNVLLMDEEGVPISDEPTVEVGWNCEFMEKRIDIPHDRIPADAAQMQIAIGVRGECPGSVWFDDLRVEPQPLTLAVSPSLPHGLFHTDDVPAITLNLYSSCTREAPVDLIVKLTDFWGQESEALNKRIVLSPRKPVEESVPFQFPRLGYFKAVVQLRRDGTVAAERALDMALVSPFSQAVFERDSPFGCHRVGPKPENIWLMREAYVKWVRTSAGWQWIEREPGKYDWSGLERQYKLYLDNGIRILAIVTGCPEWNSSYEESMPRTPWGAGHGVYPPKDYGPWERFCAALAEHFKDQVTHWEVRNEPNCSLFWMGTPQDYAKLLKTAYAGFHQGNPDCRVIFEVADTDMAFYNAVYDAGGNGCCDILGTHNYQLSHPGPPEKSTFLEEYYDMHKFLSRRGEAGKTIWDTEFCWMCRSPKNRPGWKSVGEKAQADYLVRSWTLALSAGVENVFWFPFYAYGGAELNEPHPGALVRDDYSIKPVFVSHRTLAERLSAARYSREIDVGPNARCYVFSRERDEVAIVWAIQGECQVCLATDAKQVQTFDLMNNPGAVGTYEGLLTITATGSPVYLESPEPFAEDHGAVGEELALLGCRLDCLGKFERTLRVTLRNRTGEQLRGKLSLSPGPGILSPPDAQDFDLHPGASCGCAQRFAVTTSAASAGFCTLVADTGRVRLEKQVRLPLPAAILAAPGRGPMKIDGDPSEWAEPDRAVIAEQNNPAAWQFHRVWAAYDDSSVVLALSVPKGTARAATLLFDLDNDGVMDREDFRTEITLAPGTHEEAGQLSRCADRGSETVCEAAFPLSRFGARANAGGAIGLGILFHGPKPCSWPASYDGTPSTAGVMQFTWRAVDGSQPTVYRKDLEGSRHLSGIETRFPDGMAFLYEIFASSKERPSTDLSSADWTQVVPLKPGRGRQLDTVDATARHLATRLSNLLHDCSFETLRDEPPLKIENDRPNLDVWHRDRPYCTSDSRVFHSGRTSAFIPAVGRTTESSNRWSNWGQVVPAKPGTEYTLSGYIKVGEMQDGQANLAIHSFDSQNPGVFAVHGSVAADPSLAGWQRVTQTFRTKPGDDRVRIFCDISLNGSAWFDDIHLIEGTNPCGMAEITSQEVIQSSTD